MIYTVLLPAAGSGKRMGAGQNKLFLELRNVPILIHTLRVFDRDPNCEQIVLAVKKEEKELIERLLKEYCITKVSAIAEGGEERQHSVYAGLKAVTTKGIVLVHDAARPFIHQEVIQQLVQVAHISGAAVAAVRAKDTMKKAVNGIIQETIDRESLWIIQTPQAFQYTLLEKAERLAEVENFLGTDEAMLVERLGERVHIVESTYDNVKMTTREDLLYGEAILNKREQEE
ncbi:MULTISPECIES: 2-C-methyl-D-erythritol 4-phosphate cytidylyltransferase [Psychrobacillus]|uniref:2-C-methyl-D-erythritol 4-phosphate cytidylyltransferase n=1 Tax=Psychrobacillus TaxID=1221880 RepID=UPI0008E10DB4|nr:2-C-methyl-D-erythritol 4-phosphate cytidylyltransferase [Psychrobacillus psychrodurans]MCZ8540948.1 2-C-methyl-D-erythritol 4-phosphate cytidylyltransferase [Psychrobacillus psychrodurans]SFM81291.1 2-C-methyl-D-erythritol 4-phosphate cytidylyltransferase [Psychrobacillus psychrodurans]